MIPTLQYINQCFDQYNETIFGSELPKVPVRLTRARSYLGQLSSKRRRTFPGKWEHSDFVLSFSIVRDRPEDVVRDTIIHEMIHLYILSKGISDTGPHGVEFRRMMMDINTRFGRQITVRHASTEEERDSDKQVRAHYICRITLRNGKCGIVVSQKSAIFKLWNDIEKNPQIVDYVWLGSINPYFNRYGRSRTLKYYNIPREALEKELQGAQFLIREGDMITVSLRRY